MNKEQSECENYLNGKCLVNYFDGKPSEANCIECTTLSNESLNIGDAVESVASPIARVIDGVLGTDIQNCGGCRQRKADLNRSFSKR